MENNGFEEWYQIYPRHEAKAAAMKSYAKAVRLVSPEVLIDACKRYALKRMGQDPQYTKLPATWLNQGCWADGLSQTVASPEASPAQAARFYARDGSPQLDAWDAEWKRTRGVHAPRDRRGGWWFATEWPLGHYDADKDFAGSLDVGYAAIRERMAGGGPGWDPK